MFPMTLGAKRIIEEYGSVLAVAEALIEGRLSSYDQTFVNEIVSPIILEAARIRIEMRKKDTKSNE